MLYSQVQLNKVTWQAMIQGDPEYLIPLQPLIILFQQHINYLNLYQNNLQRFKFCLVYNIRLYTPLKCKIELFKQFHQIYI